MEWKYRGKPCLKFSTDTLARSVQFLNGHNGVFHLNLAQFRTLELACTCMLQRLMTGSMMRSYRDVYSDCRLRTPTKTKGMNWVGG